jgi:transporter family-2 protein
MSSLQTNAFFLLAAVAGAAIPIQGGVNAAMGKGLGHPLWATLVSLAVSFVVLTIVMATLKLPSPSIRFLAQAPLWMWAGGVCGLLFMSMALILIPKIGASVFIAMALAGQVITSLALDHFGLLGLAQRQLNSGRLFGALLLIAGVALIQLSSTPSASVAKAG